MSAGTRAGTQSHRGQSGGRLGRKQERAKWREARSAGSYHPQCGDRGAPVQGFCCDDTAARLSSGPAPGSCPAPPREEAPICSAPPEEVRCPSLQTPCSSSACTRSPKVEEGEFSSKELSKPGRDALTFCSPVSAIPLKSSQAEKFFFLAHAQDKGSRRIDGQ